MFLFRCLTFVAVFINYSASQSAVTRCLECYDMPNPQDCSKVTRCSSSNMCFVKQFVTSGGLILYNSGCMSSTTCKAGKKRDFLNGTQILEKKSSDITICQECCNGDYCNDQGCGTTATKPPQRGPACFQCGAQDGPESCRDITVCDLQQVCGIYQKSMESPGILTTGCFSEQLCTSMNAIYYDRFNTSDAYQCPTCCNHDYCNTHCIEHTPSTSATTVFTSPSLESTVYITPTHKSITPSTNTITKPSTTLKSITSSTVVTSTPTSTNSPTSVTPEASATSSIMTSKPVSAISNSPVPSTTPRILTSTQSSLTKTSTPAPTKLTSPDPTIIISSDASTKLSSTAVSTKPSSTHASVVSSLSPPYATTSASASFKPTAVTSITTYTPTTGHITVTDKACPFKPADLIFVLDGSGSEGVINFNKQLQFVQNFTSQFEIGPNNTRVSLLTFGTTVHNQFYLNQYLNKSELLPQIMNTPYPNGETNTHAALDFVHRQTLSPHNDERNVSKIVIVLTDGQSLDPILTAHNALVLKSNPLVTTIAIGTGSGVNRAELLTIASDSNHTFQVNDFGALHTLLLELTETTCEVCKGDMSNICFVLDSSGSEGSVNFHKQLEFVNMVINEFSFDGDTVTHICVITYSTMAYADIQLDRYTSKDSLQSSILNIPYRDGETRTDLGLLTARRQLHHSDLHGTSNIAIILTDGHSTEPLSTIHQAKAIHHKGIDTFVIGIGSQVNDNELQTIASDQNHVFRVDTFDQLDSIHQQIVNEICIDTV